MTMDLKSDEGLRNASQTAIEQHRRQYHLDEWLEKLSTWLARVAAVDHQTFVTPQFQRELWDNETILVTGQGHIDVSKVIVDKSIAERRWALKQTALPENFQARVEWLDNAWEEISAMVKPLTDRKDRLAALGSGIH